jgi:HD-like signal output (HDOD) protein
MPVTALPVVQPFFPAHITLPTFPEVASRLLRTFKDENVSLDTLGALIGQDAALSAKVLRLANSARYSPTHSIARLRDAAAALGTNTLRNLALAACLSETFPRIQGLDSAAFWRHGMACAQYAVLVARSLDIDTETAYVAGLMLRTGELIMLMSDAAGVIEVEARAHEPGSRFDWEQQRWQCAHSDVTAELSRRWHFPDTLTSAFAACAEPLQAKPFSAMGAALRCAEVMADALVEGDDVVAALTLSVPDLVAHLHLDLGWLQDKTARLGDPRLEADQLLQAA